MDYDKPMAGYAWQGVSMLCDFIPLRVSAAGSKTECVSGFSFASGKSEIFFAPKADKKRKFAGLILHETYQKNRAQFEIEWEITSALSSRPLRWASHASS